MVNTATKRSKFTERINSFVASDAPIRKLAGTWSKRARNAMDEANSLSLERVAITLKQLPRKLNGFRIVQLSDIHHSPLTPLAHVERAVKIVNRLKPGLVVLTGDYVSHETEYIAPVAHLSWRRLVHAGPVHFFHPDCGRGLVQPSLLLWRVGCQRRKVLRRRPARIICDKKFRLCKHRFR